MFTLIPPTVSSEIEVIKECGLDKHDRVERDGYRPNSDKIADFIATGNILNLSRASDAEAELPAEESDFEPDSEEYREELTRDAEEFDEVPLLQHFDKIDACEILDEADKKVEEREKLRKKTKVSRKTEKDEIVEAIKEGFDKLTPPKPAELPQD